MQDEMHLGAGARCLVSTSSKAHSCSFIMTRPTKRRPRSLFQRELLSHLGTPAICFLRLQTHASFINQGRCSWSIPFFFLSFPPFPPFLTGSSNAFREMNSMKIYWTLTAVQVRCGRRPFSFVHCSAAKCCNICSNLYPRGCNWTLGLSTHPVSVSIRFSLLPFGDETHCANEDEDFWLFCNCPSEFTAHTRRAYFLARRPADTPPSHSLSKCQMHQRDWRPRR